MSASYLEQGYHYGLPMAAYIADPCAEPSLSTKVVSTLFMRTARHARREHPRFGGASSESTKASDEGSAIHSLALGGGEVSFVGEVFKKGEEDKPFLALDWKTDAAKNAAKEIRARGGVPLLEHQRQGVETAAKNIRERIARWGEGTPEVTGIAKINGVWIRVRADWMSTDKRKDVEVKSCEDADAITFVNRNIFPSGYDIQAELRLMVHKAITGDEPEFLWLPAERGAPYECGKWITPSDEMREQARRKVDYAIESWKRCLGENKFPGYPDEIVWAHPPTWAAWDTEGRVQ